jgi:hypothetical protein
MKVSLFFYIYIPTIIKILRERGGREHITQCNPTTERGQIRHGQNRKHTLDSERLH